MRKKLIFLLILAASGCTSVQTPPEAEYTRFDPFTVYLITESDKGIDITVEYTTIKFGHNNRNIIDRANFKVKCVTEQYEAEKNIELKSLIVSNIHSHLEKETYMGFVKIITMGFIEYCNPENAVPVNEYAK